MSFDYESSGPSRRRQESSFQKGFGCTFGVLMAFFAMNMLGLIVFFAFCGGCAMLGLAVKTTKPDVAQRETVLDFADRTAQYKGKTLTFDLRVGSIDSTLRECRGGDAKFRAEARTGGQVHITIAVPDKLEVPNAGFGDRVTVTFQCRDGELDRGNVATKIVRTP